MDAMKLVLQKFTPAEEATVKKKEEEITCGNPRDSGRGTGKSYELN
jgi:hypothetical protein